MFEAVDVDQQGLCSGAVRPRNCRLLAATSSLSTSQRIHLRSVSVFRFDVFVYAASQTVRSCPRSLQPLGDHAQSSHTAVTLHPAVNNMPASSEGRPSTSSMPSLRSSPTLNSQYSGGTYTNNGEGSSRQSSGRGRAVQEEHSQSSGSPLQEDGIGERDFAQRKRNRRSGGFLLDTPFSSGLRNRLSHVGGHGKEAKGKHSARSGQTHEREGHAEGRHEASQLASSSPLSREVRTAEAGLADAGSRVDSVNTDEHGQDGIRIAKTRAGAASSSTHHDREPHVDATPARPAFDPNQIVHMALSLNESRRRNLSAGQLLAAQAHGTSGSRQDGSFHSPSSGGQLRHYLNEQRRVSRNISPFGDRSPGRHMSMSAQRKGSVMMHGQSIIRDPSEATWQRVEKARAFIELRIEYLRLLQYLPPLRPDSTAPGNFVVMANNVPGSPHAHLTRVPSYMNKQHDLGRPYNPLQLLRNRRSRARERKTFEHPPEEFSDVEQVHKWVDKVEQAAQLPTYRQLDGVALPRFHEEHPRPAEPAKPARPNKIWMFTIEELLADAHWLEHGDNKTIVEDRHGRRIFPAKEPQKQDFLSPRPSTDYPEKRRRSWVEGLVADNHNTTGDESEALSERGRKRKLLPTFRAESPRHRKHNWLGSKPQSGSHTDTSDSDSDLEKRRSRKTQRMVEGDNETGALKLRMKHLMEREAKETHRAETPLLFTPDTPNKWGQDHADDYEEKGMRSSTDMSRPVTAHPKSNFDGLKLPPKQRNDPELARDPSKEYRSSFEEFDSTAPSTPIHPRHFPHIDGEVSSPPSRAGSHKRKKGKLDFLRSEESKARHEQDHLRPGSAGTDKKRSSRNASEEAEESTGIGSAIWAAPGAVKNFLGHRKNDSVNSLTSPIKEKDRRDIKEPPSAVTRFIKGVKSEGSKVGEFIFRKDRPAEEYDSDTASDRHTALGSDTDEEATGPRHRRRLNLSRTATAETIGSQTSKKTPGYHLELPSFRSSHHVPGKIDEDSADDLSDHHITRQARATLRNKSPRFEKLAPPGLDLSRMSSLSSRSPSQERISKLLARPGGVGHAGYPVTSLARGHLPPHAPDSTSPTRQPSRPTLDGKRHWSITDSTTSLSRRPTPTSIPSPSDIARVRALFLCSGIKAKTISQRALAVRDTPPAFLVRAAKSAAADLYGVPRREEHVLAARILTSALESRTASLHAAAEQFGSRTVLTLQSRIADLKGTLETDLFARVRESGDEALRTSSWVSAEAPLRVKQVGDEVERMVRLRRRRTRWVRRVGWTVLEWLLLGIMWGVWGVVTLGRGVGRVVGWVVGVVRWLLWL